MTIRDNVRDVQRRMLMERFGSTPDLTRDVREKALNAIINGMDSPEAELYMRLFATSDEQLDRLMGRDATGNDEGKKFARAYLMSNGPCNPDTVLNFEHGVTSVLDEG